MFDILQEFWEKSRIIEYGDRIIIGISGGADSVCLLRLLVSVREKYGLHLYAVHVDHGLREGEAQRDAQFTGELCRSFGIPFRLEAVNVGDLADRERISVEEAGRIARYQAFLTAAAENKCHKIAVAHNKNDNVETVLWNLFRGSGLRGISGIQAVQELEGGVRLVRPVLTVSRKEIEDFLQDLGQNYCTDSTNQTDHYTRNRIRNTLMPFLEREVNAGTAEHILQTALMASEAEAYLRQKAEEWCKAKAVSAREGEDIFCRIPVEAFLSEAPALQKMILRGALEQAAGKRKDIALVHIGLLSGLFTMQTGKRINLPYQLTAGREYGFVTIRKAGGQEAETGKKEYYPAIPGETVIEENGMCVELSVWVLDHPFTIEGGRLIFREGENIKIPQNGCTKWFDYDKIDNAVCIRTRKTGDRMVIGENGNSKKIKNLFIDGKIPREKRNSIWLLAAGEQVLWILGGRSTQGCPVSEGTKKVLIAKIKGGYEGER